jgi:hypothetical protein
MRKAFIAISVIALVAGMSAQGMAAVPLTFTQQGRLLNTDGTPVAGPVRMIFAVYANSSDTTPVWTETQSNVALNNGAFSVQLGSVTAFPTTLWTGASLYLGVTIGNDPEMTPREQITSVPYALMCAQADHASAADTATSATSATTATTAGTASALACSGCVTSAMIQPGAVSPKLSLSIENAATISLTTGTHGFVCASCSTGLLIGGNCSWDVRQNQLYVTEAQLSGNSWCCSFGNDSGGTNVGHASANCLVSGAVP